MAGTVLHGSPCGEGIGIGFAYRVERGGASLLGAEGSREAPEPGESAGLSSDVQSGERGFDRSAAGDAAQERFRFRQASERLRERTEQLAREARHRVGDSAAEILRGKILILQDPAMTGEILRRIGEGQTAEYAVSETTARVMRSFRESGDELLAGRAADVEDVGGSLLHLLSGDLGDEFAGASANRVVVARELMPSEVALLAKRGIAGIVTEEGSGTSHTAILARAYGIPAVLGVPGALSRIGDEERIAVCADTGEVHLRPSAETLGRFARPARREENAPGIAAENAFASISAGRLADLGAGEERISVLANIALPGEAGSALRAGADGIGLFRTELFFLGRETAPDEEEQYEAYRAVCEAMQGRPVTVRTLDIGGDKRIPYLEAPEAEKDGAFGAEPAKAAGGAHAEQNPQLGLRGIRCCLAYPELFRTQLRALLRAGTCGNLRIKLPMVTRPEELARTRELLTELAGELVSEGIPHAETLPLGCMIETPAAVFRAEELARKADFFSIGTNDLTMYVMCADRGSRAVRDYCDTGDPAVLSAVSHAVSAARTAGIPVSLCGEAASDPALLPRFLGMGLHAVSVPPDAVERVRGIAAGDVKNAK